MLVVAAVMWVVLHRSVFGRYLYAVGKNEEAARYSGIRTQTRDRRAYVICGVLTAISAIFFAMYTTLDLAVVARQLLRALRASPPPCWAAARLRGGEGSIVGVVLGAVAAAGAAEPRQPARHPELAQLRRHGLGHPDRRAGRPAADAVQEPTNEGLDRDSLASPPPSYGGGAPVTGGGGGKPGRDFAHCRS